MNARFLCIALAILIAISRVSNADITGRAVMRASPEKLSKLADETLVFSTKGELKNVALFLKDGAKLHAAVPATPVVLEQRGSEYVQWPRIFVNLSSAGDDAGTFGTR